MTLNSQYSGEWYFCLSNYWGGKETILAVWKDEREIDWKCHWYMDTDTCKLILKATQWKEDYLLKYVFEIICICQLNEFQFFLLIFVIDNWMFVFLGEIWKYNI